jgi:hypothetical protein
MALERIGESKSFGDCLLALLVEDGWTIEQRWDDGGVLLVGRRRVVNFFVRGDTINQAAVAAFKAAVPRAS